MGICVTRTSAKNPSETKDSSIKVKENKVMAESSERTIVRGDDDSPIVVVSASIVDKLNVLDETPTQHKATMAGEIPKRVPLVIQRTIKESDIYAVPSIPLVFVLGPQRLDVESNIKRLIEIRGRLQHLDMDTTLFEVASVIDSQDQNVIPPPKALELLISRIMSEAEDLDAMLVTGYPRSMRDVVEYTARVQRIDGVIFLDPQFDYHQDSGQITSGEIEIGSGIRNEFNNFRLNVLPIIRYFEKQEILYKVALKRPSQKVYHDIYDKVMLILSQQTQSNRRVRSPQPMDQQINQRVQSSTTISKPLVKKSARVVRITPSPRPTAVNQDIENVLSLVQAGSILQRVSSSKKESTKAK